MGRPITMTDLCELSGYTRHQMRGFLGELPMYGKRKGNARVAIEYSTHDLLIVTVCCRLDTRYGIKRQTVCAFADGIARILGGPDRVKQSGRLVLKFDQIQVDYVEQLGTQIGDGVVVALVCPFRPFFPAHRRPCAPGNEHLARNTPRLAAVPAHRWRYGDLARP